MNMQHGGPAMTAANPPPVSASRPTAPAAFARRYKQNFCAMKTPRANRRRPEPGRHRLPASADLAAEPAGQDPMHQKTAGFDGADAGLRADHGQRACLVKSGQDPMHQNAAGAGDADAGLGAGHAPRARVANSGQDPLHQNAVALAARMPGWGLAVRRRHGSRNPDKNPCTRMRGVLATRMPGWGLTADGSPDSRNPARTLYNQQRRGSTMPYAVRPASRNLSVTAAFGTTY
jgi:hypothetical protein